MATNLSSRMPPSPSVRSEFVPAPVMPTLLGIGYGNYDVQPSNFLYSLFVHTVGLALLLWLGHLTVKHAPQIEKQVAELIDPGAYILPAAKDVSGGGGGGGDRDKLQASKGNPPKFSMDPIKTPPTAII